MHTRKKEYDVYEIDRDSETKTESNTYTLTEKIHDSIYINGTRCAHLGSVPLDPSPSIFFDVVDRLQNDNHNNNNKNNDELTRLENMFY